MKKMRLKKRIYAFVLMLVMVVSLLPVSKMAVKADDAAQTNVRVHFFNEFDWASPAIQVWGGTSTSITGDGDTYYYETWKVDITNLVKDSESKWCSVEVKGDFTGFQILNPDTGEGFGNQCNDIIKSCKGDTATDIYLKRNNDTNWQTEWYLDKEWTVSIDTLLEEEEPVVEAVTNPSTVTIGETVANLTYYGNGVYETSVAVAAGTYTPAVVVAGVKATAKAITVEEDTTVIVRAIIKGTDITVIDSVNNSIQTVASLAGTFSSLGLPQDAAIANWAPADDNGQMQYIGGGKFIKKLTFSALADEVTIQYKVAFNKGWDYSIGDNGENISTTIPAGTTSLTIICDEINQKVTDSCTEEVAADAVSLIGTVRCGDGDWDTGNVNFEMVQVGPTTYVFEKVLEAGTYGYKYLLNHSTWMGGDNISLTLAKKTNVLFVYDAKTKTIYDSINNAENVAALVGTYKIASTKTIYIKNTENYEKVYVHSWEEGTSDSTQWPGVEVTETVAETEWLVVKVPANHNKFIVNNNNGTQSENIDIVGDENYYVYGDLVATKYNPDNFTTVHIKTEYAETAVYEYEGLTVKSWPGTVLENADKDGWYTMSFDNRASKVIINNNGNGAQTADLLKADFAGKTWIYVDEDNKATAYASKDEAEDAIEAAKTPVNPSVPTTFTVHVKAPSTWTTVRAYIADSSWTSITGSWDNAAEMTKGEDGWYTIDIKIKKAPHYYIFHNGAGEQSGDLEYTGTTDVWFDITTQGADGKYTGTALNQNPDELSAAEKAEAEKKAAEEAAKAEAEKKAAEEAAAAEKLANSKTFTVYVKVPASWTNACYYTWQDLAPDYPNLQPWPGTTLKDKDGEWFKAVVPNNMDRIIFNNGKDAAQTDNITISGTEYFVVAEDGKFERFATKPTSNDIAKAEAEKAARLNNTYNVYVKVDASWTNACYYAWAKEPFEDLSKWPGTKLPTETKDGWIVVKVPTFMDWIIINDGKSEGAVQTEDINTKGQECYISVNKDGSYEVVDASGNKVAGQEPAKVTEGVEKVTIYVKVPADWATPRLWAWGTEGNLYDAWPGAALVKEGDWYVATIPTWVTSLLVNGNDGAIQTQDIKLAEIGKDIYLTVISADEYTIEYKDVVAREDVVADNTTVASNKDEDKKDEVKEETDPVKDQAVVADTTEEASSVFSTQTIMLIITAIIVLICGVVVITILARKKSFNTKE